MSKLMNKITNLFNKTNKIYAANNSEFTVTLHYVGFSFDLGTYPKNQILMWRDVINRIRPILDETNIRVFHHGSKINNDTILNNRGGDVLLTTQIINHHLLRGIPAELEDIMINLPYNLHYFPTLTVSNIREILSFYFEECFFRMINIFDAKYIDINTDNTLEDFVVILPNINSEELKLSQEACNRYSHCWKHYLGLGGIEFQSFSSSDVSADLVETVILSIYGISKSTSKTSFFFALLTSIKLFTKRSLWETSSTLLGTVWNFFSITEDSSIVDDSLNILDNYIEFKKSDFFIQSYTMFSIVLSQSISGVELEEGLIKQMYEHGKHVIQTSPDFPILVTRSILTIFKKFQQAIILGSLQPIIYDEENIIQWKNEIEFLRMKFPYYSNLLPHKLSVSEFDMRLDSAIQIGNTLKSICGPQGRKVVEYNLGLLNKIKSEIIAINSVSADRLLPFAIELYGVPGVGKSSLVPLLHKVFADIRDLPYGKEYVHTAIKNSEYDDGFKPYKYVWFQDDVGQNHPNRQVGMDLEVTKLINIINRVSMTAVMADVNEKGKLPIAPHLVVVTTNVLDLHTGIYCTDPYAVMRRFNLIVDMKVKSQYADNEGRLDSNKIAEHVGIPDFWEFHLKYATKYSVNTSQKKNSAKSMNIVSVLDDAEYNIKDGCIDNMKDFLKYYSSRISLHYKNIHLQDESNDIIKHMKYCNICFDWECIHTANHVVEEQSFVEDNAHPIIACLLLIISILLIKMSQFKNVINNNIMNYFSRAEPDETLPANKNYLAIKIFVLKCLIMWVKLWHQHFTYYLDNIIGIPYFTKYVVLTLTCVMFCCPFIIILLLPIYLSLILDYYRLEIEDEIDRTFGQLTANIFEDTKMYFKIWYEKRIQKFEIPLTLFIIGYASGAFSFTCQVTVAMITTLLNLARKQDKNEAQTLKSTEFKDVNTDNIWRKSDYKITAKDVGMASQNYGRMDRSTLINILSSNVARLFVHTNDGQRVLTNIFSLGGTRWIVNKHTFSGSLLGEITVDIKYSDRDVKHTKTTTISLNDAIASPNYDAIILNIPIIPPRPNITKLLMNELDVFQGDFSGFYIGRDNDGNIKINSVKNIVEAPPPCNTQYNIRFLSGTVSEPTVKGDCGSLLVIHDGFCAIAGFHTLGSLDQRKPRIWATPISQEIFDLLPSVIPQIGTPHLPENAVLEPVHSKSPINYVESTEDLSIFGSLGGMVPAAKTRVGDSPLRSILKQYDIDTEVEPPSFKGDNKYLPLYRWLSAVSYNNCEIPSNLMECATNDYISVLLQGDLSTLRILSDYEAINGIPGCRYIDGMVKSTSAGYYLSGKKSEHMIDDIREGYPNGVNIKDYVQDEVNECLESYRSGKTYGFVYTTCLKDEPISKEKNLIGKIRVFNACPMSFVIVSRKIFMTFIKFMQENRALSEVAVGINAHSIEWQNLLKYLNHDRPLTEENLNNLYTMAGDFKSFDLSMNTNTLVAVKKVIMSILINANWSIEDLTMADTCLNEMIFKYVKINCELIRIQHSNPSGNSLTVIINCIANSLYMRCVYYYLHAHRGTEDIPLFHTKYRLTTYGDDNVLTTCDKDEVMTHITIRDTLAEWNIGYTMAEKDATFTEFISIFDATYLKRTWRWHDELGIYTAPLNIKSINKMLCVWTYNKNGFDAQFDGVIRSAFHELVFHGKSIYDKYYNIIINILDGQNYVFRHPIDKNDIIIEHFAYWRPLPYEDMIAKWQESNGSVLVLPGEDNSPSQH